MQEATPGSYLVTFQNKNFTFIHIYDKNDRYLTLEEISIPASRIKGGMDWKQWFETGGMGHTSWIMSHLNLNTGHFEAAYSFTKRGWIDIKEADHYMSTLLNLTFYSISEDCRRKIGPPPGYGKQDERPVWHPRLVVDGILLSDVNFKGWKTRWPNDRSDLSKKKIEIYLPEKMEACTYPTFFPYWIEVEGKLASGRLRVIDSGQWAKSPMPQIFI